jgi:hypothetical protein
MKKTLDGILAFMVGTLLVIPISTFIVIEGCVNAIRK